MIVVAGAAMATCAMAQAPAPATQPAPAATATPTTAAPTRPAAARPAAPGYLAPNTVDMFALMPPAPLAGDARDESDRRIFRETRALEGSPRWKMAAADAELGTAAMLKHFSCSIGMELTQQQAPRLVALAQKATRDATQAMARLLTGSTMALVTATPEYQADLATARAELAALRAGPSTQPEPARCEEEAALVKIP
jgi:hypothetical protein